MYQFDRTHPIEARGPRRSGASRPSTIIVTVTHSNIPRAANDNEPPKTPTRVRRVFGAIAKLFVTATVVVIISHHVDIPTASNDNAPPAKVPAPMPVGSDQGAIGSAFLKSRRARFADEFAKTPALRNELAGLTSLEHASTPVPVIESLMNRMDMEEKSLNQGMHSGFYGPMNRGLVGAATQRLLRNPAEMARYQRAIDEVLGGSNTIFGATDQGSGKDPNVSWPGGKIVIDHETYNDWGGGTSRRWGGGHQGSRRYREWLMANVRGEREQLRFPAYPAAIRR